MHIDGKMYIVYQNVARLSAPRLSIVETTLLLANTKFATSKFTLRTDLSAACASMILDLFDYKMVGLFFVLANRTIDMRDPATFHDLESQSLQELAYSLSIVPLGFINPDCPAPHRELHYQIARLARVSPNVVVPILLKDFLLCGKTTIFINYIVNDCTAWVYEELVEKEIVNERSAFLMFKTYELSGRGQTLATYVYTTARFILEQQYMKVNHDFEELHTVELYRRIYFSTLILATCGYTWLGSSTKIAPETYNKFESKLNAMKQNLGAIARMPTLRLQPENYEAADVALCIGVCASLEQSLAEESRVY